MPSKARTGSKESVNSKRRSPSPAAESLPAAARRQTHAADIYRLAESGAGALTPQGVLQLQRGVGNRAVAQLLSGTARPHAPGAGVGVGQVIQAKATGRGVVQRVMTAEELAWNASVQALKPQVDTLESHITRNTLRRQTLSTLRGLRDAVVESVRLRNLLNRALGHDRNHIIRLARERGFVTSVNAQIRTKEAEEAEERRAAENTRLAAGPSLLPAGSRWGGARG